MTTSIILKIVIILALLMVVYHLTRALLLVVRKPHDSRNVAKSITWRIGFSVAIFVLLMFAYLMGWITPNPSPF